MKLELVGKLEIADCYKDWAQDENITLFQAIGNKQAKLTAKQIYEWGDKDCPTPALHHPNEPSMIRGLPVERRHCDKCWQELLDASKE